MPKHSRETSWKSKFANAFRGIIAGVDGQNSFWVHLPMAIAVIVLAWFLKVNQTELCILLLCIGAVLSAEFLNSSIECLAKSITQEENDQIRDALDIASAAVLVISSFASVVGLILLGSGFARFVN